MSCRTASSVRALAAAQVVAPSATNLIDNLIRRVVFWIKENLPGGW